MDQRRLSFFCTSPNIFQDTINYKFHQERMDVHRKELMEKVFYPKRLIYLLNLGYDKFMI